MGDGNMELSTSRRVRRGGGDPSGCEVVVERSKGKSVRSLKAFSPTSTPVR